MITSHKIFTSTFSTTPSGTCSYHFHFLLGYIFHTISHELFLQHYCAFSCTPFVPAFHIRSQYEILFHFSCHTFYKVVIVLFYQYCVLHSLLKLLVLVQHKTWLLFQLSSELFSASTMFPFHLLFLALLLETVPISFCFFHSSFFPLIRLFEFILIHCIIILCCFCSFHTFNQWLN